MFDGHFHWPRRWNGPFIASAALLVIALLLGGASRAHEFRLAIVELTSLPVIVLSVFALLKSPQWPATRLFLLTVASVAALPLLQLAPLPPFIWTRLPGREEMVLALEISGLSPGWSPLTLTPDKTWRSFLALLPPIAMILGVLATSPAARRDLIVLLLLIVVVAAVLGALQVASGGEQFYLWETTNAGAVVGFFANRNHMATLCLMAIPLAAVQFAQAIHERDRAVNLARIWLAAALIALLIVAVGAIRSRMGLILLGPTLVSSLALAWTAAGRGRFSPIVLVPTVVAVIGLFAVAHFALTPIMDRFASGGGEMRFENWGYVAEAAGRYAPVGSGLGSFDAVFRSVEPLERLDNTFFNQAHNDYLEAWLETGLTGAALMVLFCVWFGRRTLATWRDPIGSFARNVARGSTIAVAVILAHSAVDYPIRTTALAVVFGLLCAIIETATQFPSQEWSRGRRRNVP